jgi:penicillin-binding protein 1B
MPAKKRKKSVKKSKKKRASRKKGGFKSFIKKLLWRTFIVSILLLAAYTVYLNSIVTEKFEGRRWSIPARVFARALELYPGLDINANQLEKELKLAGYRKDRKASTQGSYARNGNRIELVSRSFSFPDGEEASYKLRIQFNSSAISSVYDKVKRKKLSLIRIDPAPIGSIHTKLHEDRLLLHQDEIPEKLKQVLVAVEDRTFYQHYGIDPKGIVRALIANIRAGATVQGGSTLTQQLVKNYFLTRERSLLRKFNEAIMSLLLEYRYDKNEILGAYINEVFLGQDGQRAIHGFGLASEYYFKRPIQQLNIQQVALLVGLVKGPSYYNPRRHKDRAAQRRNTVLKILLQQNIIDQNRYSTAVKSSLGISRRFSLSTTPFPAFMDRVRTQLQQAYDQDDLTSEGLRIFTTLDPQVQWAAEDALSSFLNSLGKKREASLQGAIVVSRRDSAAILAIVGDKNRQQSGYNRAINSRRQIGSLIKPAIYLTALEKGYTLSSLLEDKSLTAKSSKGKLWKPHNYDKKEHGLVPLHVALAKSYNLSAARLGMKLKVPNVLNMLKRLGVETEALPYPAVLLGSLSLSPLQVSQMYQTLADQGFYSPQHVIVSVQNRENQSLRPYPIRVEQRIDSSITYLLDANLQEVVSRGTAKGLARYISAGHYLAGKTGTTNDLRDSWFAGFGNDLIGVVWLGRDDNKSSGFTGSSGALKIWGKMMKQLSIEPLELNQPDNIKWLWVDSINQRTLTGRCKNAEYLPYVKGTQPKKTSSCEAGHFSKNWLNRLFQTQ